MFSQEIIEAITDYLHKVRQAGIDVTEAVLFGSFAGGTATENSDIDLLIIAPEFDQRNEVQLNLLWELRAFADPRIEPIACGTQQWLEDEATPIISIARETGLSIPLKEIPHPTP